MWCLRFGRGSAETLGDLTHQRQRHARQFGDVVLIGAWVEPVEQWRVLGWGAVHHDAEAPVVRGQVDEVLMPMPVSARKLAQRESIEELVGNQDDRAFR